MEAVIDAGIKRYYLSRQKRSVAALHREIKHDCQAADLPVPSVGTVRRRVAALAPSVVMRARNGAAAVRQRFKPLRGSLETEYPLDVVQIDHTLVDVVAVDDVFRKPLGRVWLTVVLDVDTRVVCGFYMSPEHPSTTSVALAITHAVLPKGPWLSANDLTLPWPAAGLPRCIHVDNAREFHSQAMMRACQQHGIALEFRPVGRPHFGGHIERLMGTLMTRIHELPGTTFSNIQERGDADPEALAVLTLSELQRVFALEVLGPYHHEVHSGLGMPPLAAWAERLDRRSSPPLVPQNPDEFLYSFLPFKEVVVRREGIRLHSIFYYDNVITRWIGTGQVRLRAKYDPRNLFRVFLSSAPQLNETPRKRTVSADGV
ncbi:Mu transposase C-terminal domain-containing protein, partial [Muricoccus vinaceus]